MSKVPKYIPLSQPEAIYDHSNGAVINNLVLPVGVDTERILINIRSAERAARWCGVKSVHMVTREGDQANDPMIGASLNSNGTGIATAISFRKPERPQVDVVFDNTENPLNVHFDGSPYVGTSDEYGKWRMAIYKSGAMALYFDKMAIQDRLRQDDNLQRGLVDEAGWSGELNKAAKQGFKDAAREKYMTSGRLTDISEVIAKPMIQLAIINGLQKKEYFFPLLFGVPGLLKRTAQLYRVTTRQESHRDFNWSIHNTVRTDRIIAGKVAATTSTFFKYQK